MDRLRDQVDRVHRELDAYRSEVNQNQDRTKTADARVRAMELELESKVAELVAAQSDVKKKSLEVRQ